MLSSVAFAQLRLFPSPFSSFHHFPLLATLGLWTVFSA